MSLKCLIWASLLRHLFRLVSQLSAHQTTLQPPEEKAKGQSHFMNKDHPKSKCFQTGVCICSHWATQRKTQESVLCVLAILEIRSGKQRMKMFVYGLSQCSDVCFRSQGCGVGHVYLLGPFSRDSPEPWRKSEGSPGFHKLPRGDILGRNAHITWPWVSILHTMLPQCQRT